MAYRDSTVGRDLKRIVLTLKPMWKIHVHTTLKLKEYKLFIHSQELKIKSTHHATRPVDLIENACSTQAKDFVTSGAHHVVENILPELS